MNTLHIATKGVSDKLFVYVKRTLGHLDTDKKIVYQLPPNPNTDDLCVQPLRFALDGLDPTVTTVVYANFTVNRLDLSEFSDFVDLRLGQKDFYSNPASQQLQKYVDAVANRI